MSGWRKAKEKKELKFFPTSGLEKWVDESLKKKSGKVGLILWILLILLNN